MYQQNKKNSKNNFRPEYTNKNLNTTCITQLTHLVTKHLIKNSTKDECLINFTIMYIHIIENSHIFKST